MMMDNALMNWYGSLHQREVDQADLFLPLLQDDIVGAIAAYVTTFDLRTSFIRVCKRWYRVGMPVAKGTRSSYSQVTLMVL